MAGIRHDLDNERAKLSQAAGEARREAWRWFGGFWVWLASMLATGALARFQARWPDVRALSYGHMGDSNLHLVVNCPSAAVQPSKEIKALVNEAAEFSKESPEPSVDELWTDIYA